MSGQIQLWQRQLMNQDTNDRGATSSTPEDLFADLFTQVFGPEKTLMLVPQYPIRDIYDGSRFVDYALRTRDERIAFEIDGATWHVPEAVPVLKYEDDLLKQNSLIHQGWRVFRWTDRQIAQEPDRVKDQLMLFLERLPELLAFDDFLPRQTGAVVELRAAPRRSPAGDAADEGRGEDDRFARPRNWCR